MLALLLLHESDNGIQVYLPRRRGDRMATLEALSDNSPVEDDQREVAIKFATERYGLMLDIVVGRDDVGISETITVFACVVSDDQRAALQIPAGFVNGENAWVLLEEAKRGRDAEGRNIHTRLREAVRMIR